MFIEIKNCEKYQEAYAVEVIYTDLFSTKIYPDGKGGQLGDRGHINNIKILEVKNDKIILSEKIEPGEYEYYIDMERRNDIAVQHTAEHLFSGIALSDYKLNNVGFRMGEEVSTVDLDSENISNEMTKELENKVNKAISKGAKVLGTTVMKYEIPSIEGLRKKISPKIKDEYIRLIKVEGYDLCACAGFHVGDIKDIKFFKILSHEKLKGKTRFTFIAGDRVIKDYNLKSAVVKTLNHKFSSQDGDLIDRIEKFENDYKDLKNSYSVLMNKYSGIIGENLLKNAVEKNSHKIIAVEDDKEMIKGLKKYFSNKDVTFVGIIEDNAVIQSRDIDCGIFIKEILKTDGSLKGGGGKTQGNIKGRISKETVMEIFNKIAE